MNANIKNSRITHTHCPVCQSPKIAFALTAKDHTVSSEFFDIWHCSRCQARFTQNIPDEASIGNYYKSEEYISHSNTQKGVVNKVYHIVRNFTLRQKRNRVQKLSGLQEGSILDIGCGTGEFLNMMQKSSWQVLGLEPDEEARKGASDNYGIKVQPSLTLFDLEAEQFDVVSMWHVLEHVHQLHEYLETIHSILKSSGIFLIAVPNYQSLDAEKYQASWAAYDVPRHLYHFEANAMKYLLAQYGFELTKMYSMPFDAFYVSLLSEKYKKGKIRLIPAFVSGLRSYFSMVKNVRKGSSILYVARKEDS